MFYKSDRILITLLLNVYHHLINDWDFLLIICGDTGTGKSVGIGLNLIETWYKIILGRECEKERHKHLTGDYNQWLNNFKEFDQYDINIYDEGASELESKEFMNRISRDITKLFNIFRGKRFFSVIIIPSFFHLNKYFRENRLRGCMYASSRGTYLFYSRRGIGYLNAYNQGQKYKTMFRARPYYTKSFPDYKGEMLQPYQESKMKYMNAAVENSTNHGKTEVKIEPDYILLGEKVKELREVEKLSWRAIGERLNTNYNTARNAYKYILEN